MKDRALRFCNPINMSRPRGARLIEGFSPKLGRRLQFFDHATFGVWIGLEADPSVSALCERPTRLGPASNYPIIDFWIRRCDSDEFLMVTQGNTDISLPSDFEETPLRRINAVDRAASSMWISNWSRMLPIINAARSAISKTTMKSVSRFVREPTSLAAIERQFSSGDPTVVRAERVNDFAAPCVINLLCRVVLFQSGSFALAVG